MFLYSGFGMDNEDEHFESSFENGPDFNKLRAKSKSCQVYRGNLRVMFARKQNNGDVKTPH